ncbi:MAG: response regulator [Paenibacillaceae bacterium]
MYRIMVIDDEPLTRTYLKVQIPLLDPQWVVEGEAMDGQEALEILQWLSFDLIITDIKMPIMDGLELCRQVSIQYPAVKIVILSGHDEFSMAQQAIQYGVNEYLLKPIVRDELRECLRRMFVILDKERQAEQAHATMLHLSADTKKQVIRNFFRAAAMDNSAEVKTLYPLLYRMKVSLIESEGAIMILALDEDLMLQKSVYLADLSVFKYILYQVVTEIIEMDNMECVSFDEEEYTIILITGEDEEEILLRCRVLHEQVNNVLFKNTGITVTGAVGSCVYDALQLHNSYQKATQMLPCRLVGGGGSVYEWNERSIMLKQIQAIDDALTSVSSGVLENNEIIYTLGIKNLLDVMELNECCGSRIVSFGYRLVSRLADALGDSSKKANETALFVLRDFQNNEGWDQQERRERIIEQYISIVHMFVQHEAGGEDENSIVRRAKAYIYDHYAEPLSLGLIAEQIGVSVSYLSNIFHKSVNESYIKFLTRVRMEQAAKLLKSSSEEKIYDVSDKVGYVSVKHFSHVFKQFYGIPPGEYQERNHKVERSTW